LVLTPINSVSLAANVAQCDVTGCFPTGVDISKVVGGNAVVLLGNATLAGPYYIEMTLNTTTGLGVAFMNKLLACVPPACPLVNIESPEFSHRAWNTWNVAGDTGNVYFGAFGFLPPPPLAVGVAVGTLTGPGPLPAIVYDSSYVNADTPTVTYGSNISVADATVTGTYIWQSVWDGINTYVDLYSITGTVVTSYGHLNLGPNTPVFTITAFPGR
jgi:hypothetical protein